MTDLSLISFDEIWQELCKRYDSCIFCWVNNKDGKSETVQVNFHGGKLTCIGLATHCQDKILADMRENTELSKED